MGKRGPRPLSRERLEARGSWRAKHRKPASDMVFEPSDPPRRPPRGLGKGGKEFWRSLAENYGLNALDYHVLYRACEVIDLLDDCQRRLDDEGIILEGPRGGLREHPLLKVQNAARRTYLACLKELRVDSRVPVQRPAPERQAPPHGNSKDKTRFILRFPAGGAA